MCFPIFANEQVDKVFGIGAVKITMAHDRNAYEVGVHKREQEARRLRLICRDQR
jgi:valyl-tRNA synthetase